MNVAIIPARSGSKRLKGKNIKIFKNKPVIYWSILAAKKTGIFDKIIVSTNSFKIAKIANKFGAETPFIRAKELANDKTSTISVIKNAISKLRLKKAKICCIYPCAPLISSKDIISAYYKLKKNIDFVISASTFSTDITRSFFIKSRQKKLTFLKKNQISRKKKYFYDAGQFYWGDKKSWEKNTNILKSKIKILKIPRWRSQDINDIEDWQTALKLSEIK